MQLVTRYRSVDALRQKLCKNGEQKIFLPGFKEKFRIEQKASDSMFLEDAKEITKTQIANICIKVFFSAFKEGKPSRIL